MSLPPEKNRVEIDAWPGRISNADPTDIPPGAAQVQDNIQSLVPGELSVRKGIQRSTAYTPSSATSNDIISQYTYQRPDGDWLITVDTGGNIKARRGAVARTLSTSVSTFAPWSFAKARNGDLIGVNGIDRGIRWDGITAAAEQLGITAPAAAPSATTPVGGGASAGSYTLAFRYVDNTLPTPIVSPLSPSVAVTAAASDQFSWADLTASSEARVVNKELWRSTVGYPNILYYIGTVANGTTTFTSDTFTDAALIAAAAADSTKKLLVLSPNGDVNGRRQVPPPNYKKCVVFFQDRAFYLGDVNYTAGTITTNGSTTLTGASTAWVSTMAGRYMYLNNTSEVAPLVVSSSGGATSITTTVAASSSASGITYGMLPAPTARNQLLYSEIDEPESVSTTNSLTIQENTGDDDEITGGMPFGSVLYILKERHIYALTFVRQPKIDADCRLLAHRGCFNQRCWDFHEGVAYLMDQSGCYSMTVGGSITPISDQIQDIFRDGTLDLANSKWFHVCVDPVYQLVRFYVGFAADSSTRPKRALVYNIRTQAWWTETYPDEIGGSSRATSSGAVRAFIGGENDVVFQHGAGESEVITAQVRGTVTSATSTTTTDSGASFTTSGANSVVGAWVCIESGTGKGQYRKVTAATSTELTHSAWTTTPSTDSVYRIGIIPYTWKGGNYDFTEKDDLGKRGFSLFFEPTSGANVVNVRRYFNYDSSAETNTKNENYNNGLVERASGSADDTVNVKSARSARGTSTGWAYCPLSGHVDDRVEGKRSITPEIGGFKGDDSIVISAFIIHGAAA